MRLYTAAAIQYVCDQNAPSDPFILRAAMPDNSFKSIEKFLLKWYDENLVDKDDPHYDSSKPDKVEVFKQDHYGKYALRVNDDDLFMFVSEFEELPSDSLMCALAQLNTTAEAMEKVEIEDDEELDFESSFGENFAWEAMDVLDDFIKSARKNGCPSRN